MPTAVVKAMNKGVKDDEPLKVIYSEKEPAKTYIWGHPNGKFYVFTDCKWQPIDMPKKDCGCGCNCSDYVHKAALEGILTRWKKDIISSFLRINRNSCDDKDAIIDKLAELETAIQELQGVDTETDSRLDRLEEHDATDCVTATDIEP